MTKVMRSRRQPERKLRRVAAPGLVAALVAVLAFGLAACGKSEGGATPEREPFSLTLDFYPNPDHAGIYSGIANGAFEQAGLDLSVTTPTDPAAPIKQVAAGQTDLAISYEPEVLLAREKGLDVRAVAAIVDQPLSSMIWLRGSGIREVADLRGKTVATAGIPYQDAYLDAILRRADVPLDTVERVSVGLGLMPAILSGRADALLGAFRNIEGVDLQRRGREPTIRPVNELGIPTYNELVLVTSASTLEEKSDQIRLFIAALERGTEAAIADPAAATAAILAANEALEPGLTRAWIDATLPLLEPAPGQPYGYMDPGQWAQFIAWMRDNRQIGELPSPDEVLTNELLPTGTPPAE